MVRKRSRFEEKIRQHAEISTHSVSIRLEIVDYSAFHLRHY